jgi:hypothetical protein
MVFMCHHGIDLDKRDCDDCAVEKAAEKELASRGIEPVAVPESGNCLIQVQGESHSLILDARIWIVLKTLAEDYVKVSGNLRS